MLSVSPPVPASEPHPFRGLHFKLDDKEVIVLTSGSAFVLYDIVKQNGDSWQVAQFDCDDLNLRLEDAVAKYKEIVSMYCKVVIFI